MVRSEFVIVSLAPLGLRFGRAIDPLDEYTSARGLPYVIGNVALSLVCEDRIVSTVATMTHLFSMI